MEDAFVQGKRGPESCPFPLEERLAKEARSHNPKSDDSDRSISDDWEYLEDVGKEEDSPKSGHTKALVKPTGDGDHPAVTIEKEDVPEADPGVGIKITAEADGDKFRTVELFFKADCPTDEAFAETAKKHTVIGYVALDTSASMCDNGGGQGVKNVVENFGAMARGLHPSSVPVKLGAFMFDEDCIFPGGVTAGFNTAVHPIDKWDHSESPQDKPTFSSTVSQSLHTWGKGTNFQNAVNTGLDHVVDRLLELSPSKRANTVGILLLCTDGIANGGESDANKVRKLVDDRIDETGLCICVAAIALGTDPDPQWLRTLCGKTGVASWAPNPRQSAEAFQKAISCVSNSSGIFSAAWNVHRLQSVSGEHENILAGTKHFGLLTSKNVLSKFELPVPPGGFLPGDKVSVVFENKSYSFTLSNDTTTVRDDILYEVKVLEELQAAMENSSTDVKVAIDSARNLSAKIAKRTPSRATRAIANDFSKIVMRSLSITTTTTPPSSAESEGPTYRSLGGAHYEEEMGHDKCASTEHVFMEAASQACYD